VPELSARKTALGVASSGKVTLQRKLNRMERTIKRRVKQKRLLAGQTLACASEFHGVIEKI